MSLKGRRVLVTGAKGMLGYDLVPELTAAEATVIATDIVADSKMLELDISKYQACLNFVQDNKPEVIINTAAYTAVDAAQDDPDTALRVNALGAANVAAAASKVGARMIQISTDYVFGAKHVNAPISENVELDPCGVYGLSKAGGEALVQQILGSECLIIRTSWLHGVGGKNFVDTITKAASERDELRVVNDQFGSPTWTGWLASIIVKLIKLNARGTFHASSRGGISWYDFAKEIVEQQNLKCKVNTQTTEELGRRAPRPAYSVLDVSKLERFLEEPCPQWQMAVKAHLEARR